MIMKELSIEEKAKAYDEALEKSKRLYEQGIITENLAYIFPELKESEDEMVRKAIIEHFEGSHSSMYPYKGFTKEQILAWLERQGKQKSIDDLTQQEAMDIAVAKCFEQGKQKPADNEMIEILRTEYEKGRADAIAEMQNPAWSEEDEKMIQDIINDIAIAQEQVYCKNRCEDEINWLKSLRPKTTWKPSDKQMEILWKYAEQNNYDGFILTSLHQQLKKLRE